MIRPLSLILFALPISAAAQDEIVITGTGLDAPPGEAALATVEIDRTRITESASGRIEDVLRDAAGIAQFRRADSRSSHPTAQGLTLRGLGGNASSRALLLLDGVPQADPFGGWVAFPAYLPERLARVRVTRGGGSGYHGAGALAGTVELFSASADSLGPFALRAGYGSRDAIDLVATAGATLGQGEVTAAAQFARGDGFVPIVADDRGSADRAAPYRQASVMLRGVVPLADAVELQASLTGFRDERERGTAFTPVDSRGVDASIRLVGRDTWRWAMTGWLQHRDFATGFASVNATRTLASPTLDQQVPATGQGLRIEIEPPLGTGITLRAGGDLRGVSGRTAELYSFVAGSATRRRSAGGASTTAGLFSDLSIARGPWTLTAGGRVDRWAIRDGRLFEAPIAGGPALTDTHFADRTGWEASGRVGAALRADAGVTLRAAAYRGWRLPTLNELYRPFRAGPDATAANALLAPERVQGIEAGADLAPGGGVTVAATAFLNRLDAAIGNVTLGSGPGSFPGVGFVAAGGAYRVRQNLDAIDSRGIEVDARWESGRWGGGLSWSYVDARVRARGAAAALDGRRPAQTAPHQLSAHLGYRHRGLSIATTTRYVAAQYEDDLNARALADAWTIDAVIRVPLGAGIAIQARGENLTDTQIETGISGTGVVERAAPRTLWFAVTYRPD
ncbi:outer membrane receptor protein involved in Fe transport [Sphingomonas sp. BE123]|uniref:TonB-dependent receptor n=1 Tax=Sphingomonas sp. BE123 TaxID=2817842 RepID=UPI0028563021|nr:TonB-dependent receptor [Sphingomonas sp. BE123]MDR6852303.1 outer membrane receptor protein involved in Fe transport [Sphingomonas sp. BE123]